MTTTMTLKNDKAAALLDELLKDYQKPDDILGESGLLKQLTQAVVERALDAELTHHLGNEASFTIQEHLREIYGVEISPTLISQVTDAVLDEMKAWRERPLDAIYPIVYLDALTVKVRDHGHIVNKAVYPALGVVDEASLTTAPRKCWALGSAKAKA